MFPLVSENDVRALLRTVRVNNLVVQHSDNWIITHKRAKYIADSYGAKYVELPGRNIFHVVEPGGVSPSSKSPNSSPASRPTWLMIGCWPLCCSPTSWTPRVGPRSG